MIAVIPPMLILVLLAAFVLVGVASDIENKNIATMLYSATIVLMGLFIIMGIILAFL